MWSMSFHKGLLFALLLQMRLPSNVSGQSTADTPTVSSSADSVGTSDFPSSSMSSISPTGADSGTTMGMTSMTGMTNAVTDMMNTSLSMISCRAFTCNYSSCYTMFMSTNASACPSNANFCELRRLDGMTYSVGCSGSCGSMCNGSMANCTVDCCNTTDCLNTTLSGMVATTTAVNPTTTTTTPATTSPATTAPNNGKKCDQMVCTGTDCYVGKKGNVVLCPPNMDFCQLKKTTANSVITWQAGCSTNCSAQTPCTASSPNCYQECCSATMESSCLKLDGKNYMTGSATRFSHYPVGLLVSPVLLWLLNMMVSL